MRIRNRLSVSILFDTILIWVEEYGACTYGTPASDNQANGKYSLTKLGSLTLMFFLQLLNLKWMMMGLLMIPFCSPALIDGFMSWTGMRAWTL